MNVVLLEPDEACVAACVAAGSTAPPRAGAAPFEIELADRRARHLLEVMRVIVGARVRVGVVDGALGHAEVIAVATGRCRLRVTLERAAPPQLPLHLILAVPRPKVLLRTVAIAASFAVERIDLCNAWRVDKSYLGSPALAAAALARAARDGAEQGATTRLPALAVHPRLMGLLDAHPLAPRDERARLIAHPTAAVALEHVVTPGERRAVIAAVGPEGGWIARELATFEARGFVAVTFGDAVLRVEAAIAGLLAQVQLLRRLSPLR